VNKNRYNVFPKTVNPAKSKLINDKLEEARKKKDALSSKLTEEFEENKMILSFNTDLTSLESAEGSFISLTEEIADEIKNSSVNIAISENYYVIAESKIKEVIRNYNDKEAKIKQITEEIIKLKSEIWVLLTTLVSYIIILFTTDFKNISFYKLEILTENEFFKLFILLIFIVLIITLYKAFKCYKLKKDENSIDKDYILGEMKKCSRIKKL
jgi:hypothetical protein